MKKEEVLKEARKENKYGDERDRHIDNKAFLVNNLAMYIGAVFIYILNMKKGRTSHDIFFIIFLGISARKFMLYKENKDKQILLTLIFSLIVTILSLINYLKHGLGI